MELPFFYIGNMKTELLPVSSLILNPDNPRFIVDEKYQKLLKSIKDFPQMLELRPLVVDENNVVLGGNMRLRAVIELGFENVSVVRAKDLTDEQKQEFIFKDNISYGSNDWDIITSNWELEALLDWGLDIPELESDPVEIEDSEPKEEKEKCPECGK